ncbi:MAG: TetR/AcrR family transcriptional regulator [Cyanobacteria bacterium SBLK]|nr:TetR/AcrR family transcriptional regulator [Cyanobacteria bacterium SBLK]
MQTSRDEAIRKLIKVFRTYGYEGTTLSLISKMTGLGRASLYHHFPKGKQEMAQATLMHVHQQFCEIVLKPLQQETNPRDRLQGMCEGLNQFYDRGRAACLIAVFSLGGEENMFREPVKKALQEWIASLENVLREAGCDLPRERSREVVMQIQGGLMVARVLDDTTPFEQMLARFPERLLEETNF